MCGLFGGSDPGCSYSGVIFYPELYNASTPCSLQAFGIRCIRHFEFNM